MNRNQLFQSMNQIDDSLLELTEQEMKPKKKKIHWARWGAVAAAACLAAGAALFPWNKISDEPKKETIAPGEMRPECAPETPNALLPYLIAEAKYPEVPQYPERSDYPGAETYASEAYDTAYRTWWEYNRSQTLTYDARTNLNNFFRETTLALLSDKEGENKVYSPLNLYIALSMLAETTDGSSREQILELLGPKDLKDLRTQIDTIWNATYRNDGYVTTLLANSFWLNDNISYQKGTLQTLSDQYYASSFFGEMGSDEYNRAFRDWLNSQTGNLLKDQVETLEMSPDTVLSLASTIYYSACWYDKFDPEKNTMDIFHAPNSDITTEYMNYFTHDFYLRGEHFGAISWDFDQAGDMWLLLPDEGYTPEEILKEESFQTFLTDQREELEQTYVELTLALPKFDISSQLELKDSLKNLGITDVFASETSDFTPLTEDVDVFLSKVEHSARVRIDEEGCVGVAYTTELLCGDPEPQGKVDFILDRPFIFCITSDDDLPLFVGIVNNP